MLPQPGPTQGWPPSGEQRVLGVLGQRWWTLRPHPALPHPGATLGWPPSGERHIQEQWFLIRQRPVPGHLFVQVLAQLVSGVLRGL